MHAQFDLKPKRVSAWQIPVIANADELKVEDLDIPGWLNDKLNGRAAKFESFPSIPHWCMRLELPGKKVKYALAGYWVTCDETGAVYAYDEEDMASMWERVPS